MKQQSVIGIATDRHGLEVYFSKDGMTQLALKWANRGGAGAPGLRVAAPQVEGACNAIF